MSQSVDRWKHILLGKQENELSSFRKSPIFQHHEDSGNKLSTSICIYTSDSIYNKWRGTCYSSVVWVFGDTSKWMS